MSEPTAVHPPLVPDCGVLVPDPGCSSCGTCMEHDGCAFAGGEPLAPGDCENCGACADCIADCSAQRSATEAEMAGAR